MTLEVALILYVVVAVVVGTVARVYDADERNVALLMPFWPLALAIVVASLPWLLALALGDLIRDAIDAREPPDDDD